MKKRRKQYSAGAIIWIIFKYVSLVFFSFVAVIPIISCVITAFKTEDVQEALDLLLSLNVAVNVRVEQANKAVRSAAVSALLYILAVGSPLLVGQLRIHLQLAGSEVGVHRRQQNDILSGRESLQQLGNIVDILQHTLNSSVVEEVAALGSVAAAGSLPGVSPPVPFPPYSEPLAFPHRSH